MSDEILGLSLSIIIITFIILNIVIIINKDITKCGKIISTTLIVISTIISYYLVFDYQKIRDNQYKYTKELIIAQRHLLNISDYAIVR